MKREINCEKCAAEWRALVGRYPGEEISILKGKALRDYRCDGCDIDLEQGEDVCAVSVYTERDPYFKWEDGFLQQAKGGE